MSNNPFENNPNYNRLFRILSTPDRCDVMEVVELYKKKNYTKDEPPYCLLRYRQLESQFPVKLIHKFSDLIAAELVEDSGKTVLFITTVYGTTNTIFNRFNACCGTKIYTLQVEQQLYNIFFN